MAMVPRSILEALRKCIFRFLSAGTSSHTKYHLEAWQNLAIPKGYGGWGMKHIFWFEEALSVKSLWRALFNDSLWSDVIRNKYLKSCLPTIWLRNTPALCSNASIIWRGLYRRLYILKKCLSWNPRRGIFPLVGIDPIIGLNEDFLLSLKVIELLWSKNIEVLSQVFKGSTVEDAGSDWLSATDLGLTGMDVVEWHGYVERLRDAGIRLTNTPDQMVWDWGGEADTITARRAYEFIVAENVECVHTWWHPKLWRWRLPLKICCFIWLCLNGKILTWDQLPKRGVVGPGICLLCHDDSESAGHLFIQCPFVVSVWKHCQDALAMNVNWNLSNLNDNLQAWFVASPMFPELPFFIIWEVWKNRNRSVFQGIRPSRLSRCRTRSQLG